MNEDMPFIVVDHQKLFPLRRVQHVVPDGSRQTALERQTSSVVDRVTISREGKQLAQRLCTVDTNALEADPRVRAVSEQGRSSPRQLTYSPRRPR